MTDITKEKIEELLRSYRSLVSRINIRLISYAPGYSISGIDYDKIRTGKTNEIYSDVESYVMKTFGKDSEVWRMIRKRDIIVAALKALTEDEYYIVRMVYFEGKTYNYVAENIYPDRVVSESTIGKKKKDILCKLEKVGILEAM